MKLRTQAVVALTLIVVGAATANVPAAAQEYQSLEGLKRFDVAYDVRIASPKGAKLFLNLIHESYRDKSVLDVTDNPRLVVVVNGPAIKLISTDRSSFSPEDQELIGDVAEILAAMSKDGIRIEGCLGAARVLGVDPETFLPEVEAIGNAWISLAGYQAQGYSMIPVF